MRVQANATRATTKHFVLLAAPRDIKDSKSTRFARERGFARLGIIVTKKVGNAPTRNRIKRLCRECFRLWPKFVPTGVDLVVIARAGAGELGLRNVQAEWSHARPALIT
ncbi:MAG: ribonuclease P protein component [Polyangiaceae bacterium]|nr:ribonuclease P protein component [Polyangiaceae bacterium]